MTALQLLYGLGVALVSTRGDELFQGSAMSDFVRRNEAGDDPQCTHHMHNFYRKMACGPEVTPGAPCPTSYNCPTLTSRSKDHCYHEGKKYPVGVNITRDTVDLHSPCIESCQCVRLYEGVRFVCVQKSMKKVCPDAEGCQRVAFPGDFSCCDVGVRSCNLGKKDSVKCIYGGQSYSEGEKIAVSQDPTCVQCVCASGFNGSVSPQFCRTLSCALEFWGDAPIMLSRGCIPTYVREDGCCPVVFRCPEHTDRVIRAKTSNSTANNSVKKCKFGNLTMDVGDYLSPWQIESGREVECSCTIPPWPSCVSRDFVISDSLRRELAREGLD